MPNLYFVLLKKAAIWGLPLITLFIGLFWREFFDFLKTRRADKKELRKAIFSLIEVWNFVNSYFSINEDSLKRVIKETTHQAIRETNPETSIDENKFNNEFDEFLDKISLPKVFTEHFKSVISKNPPELGIETYKDAILTISGFDPILAHALSDNKQIKKIIEDMSSFVRSTDQTDEDFYKQYGNSFANKSLLPKMMLNEFEKNIIEVASLAGIKERWKVKKYLKFRKTVLQDMDLNTLGIKISDFK